ncbi:hypothetical protein ACFE04_028673 [Oxalis oulophora]
MQIYSNLTSLVGVVNTLKGGFSWLLLKCIHEEQMTPRKQALRAYCNTKLSVAVTIMEESFRGMHDSQTGIEMLPQVMYNWGSVFSRLNYHGFYSIVLEKDDVKNTGKESLQWGLDVGLFSGLTYGLYEARGVHDWTYIRLKKPELIPRDVNEWGLAATTRLLFQCGDVSLIYIPSYLRKSVYN